MGKIALLVSRDEMLYQAHNILQERKYEIDTMRVIRTEDAVMEARNAISGGATIIIARGLQASLIKQYTNIPVVEIVITAQEMALLVTRAKQIIGKPRPVIAVVGFKNMFCDMSYFDTIYDIELRTYYARTGAELPEVTMEAVREQADLIIGGDTAVEIATREQIPSLFLSITEDSLKTAFSMAESMDYAMGVEKRSAAQMETLLDYSFSGVVKVDPAGIITDVNLLMEDILSRKREELIGKPLCQVFRDIEEEKLGNLLSDGKDTYSLFMQVNHTAVFAILAPVQFDGRVDGAIMSCHKVKKRQEKPRISSGDKGKKALVALGNFQDILQKSKSMKDCIHLARLFSQSDQPVLLIGETGTEKRLMAQGIHNNSLRNEGPYIQIPCDGIQEEHQVDVIFGEKGAAALADGGTMLLEGVDCLSPSNQYRLYQLIRYHQRSGRDLSQPVKADVRIIATAAGVLEQKWKEGNFREDLYYLLQGLSLTIPPLRNRREDLRQKITDRLQESNEHYGRYHVLTSGAWAILLDYPWKGNLLQVDSFCDRLVLSAQKRSIDEQAVLRLLGEIYPEDMTGREETTCETENTQSGLWENQDVAAIRRALEKFGGNREKTAAELGISKATLWRRMKKYGL